MGLLEKTRVYTIGNMEYSDGRDWRDYVKKELTPLGIIVLDPYHKPWITEIKEDVKTRKKLAQWRKEKKYSKLCKRMAIVRSDDLEMVRRSDFLIAFIKPNVPTWGSAEELAMAINYNKPTFIIVEPNRQSCPLWVFGMGPSKYLYDSVEDAVKMIKKIDSGKKKIDSLKWHLFKSDFR